MTSFRMWVAALLGAFAVASLSATSTAMAASYDGYWTLVAQTTKGHCGVTRWGVAISGGRLYYPGGFFMGYPVGLGGTVAPSGRTRVIVTAGPRVGRGAGQLGRVQGRGTWAGQGPSGTCSGIWTAARASVQAPAPFWMPRR
jgi:hypothetical protein